MGKQSKPTPEELKFVYELILKGYSNREIMEEYTHLYEIGQLKFPLRGDQRFIKDRRKELEAASEVLQQHVKKKVDPIISKRREEHFDRIADVATLLLANDLDSVTENPTREDQFGIFKYTIWHGGSGLGITHEQLSQLLDQNIESVSDQPNDAYDLDCLLSHLKDECPQIKSKGFGNFVKENPYKLIEALRIFIRRKTFKGTCPVCKDWQ